MESLEQGFNAVASGAIAHLRGRERALSGFGWIGRRAEWITLVCLHRGVFIRARWARWMDARPGQLRGGVHTDRAGLGRRGGRARHPGGSEGFAASMPGAPLPSPRRRGHPPGRVSPSKTPMRRVEPERPRMRRTGLSDAAKAGEPAYPPWPHFACPRRELAGGCAPSDPTNGNGAS